MDATGSRGSGRWKEGTAPDDGPAATPGPPGWAAREWSPGTGRGRPALVTAALHRGSDQAQHLVGVRHAQPPCQRLAVAGTGGRVTDGGHHGHRRFQALYAAFHGVQVELLQRGADSELEQRPPGLYQGVHCLVALALAQVAGIRSCRLHGHIGLGGKPLVLLKGAQRRLLACGVAVEGEDDLSPGAVVGQQPAGDLDVLSAERRSASGHRRRDSREVARHDVRVALHHHKLPVLGDAALGEVDPVEHLGFFVQRGLGGVEVFGALVILVELPGAETDGVPRDVPDGPDQAAAETVVDAPVSFGEHAGELKLGVRETPVSKVLEQCVPALGRVAHAELLGGGTVEPAPVQERPGRRGAGCQQLRLEELVGDLVGIQQPLPAPHFLAVGAGAAVLVPELVADPGGQLLHGFLEGAVVLFLHKGDGVAVFAAAEAVVAAYLRADGKRGRALVVEGAQALEGPQPGALERDVAVNHFLDVRALAYFIDIFTFDQPRHRAILAPGSDLPAPAYDGGRRLMAFLTTAMGGSPPAVRTWPEPSRQ
jgi:hypothetical protein